MSARPVVLHGQALTAFRAATFEHKTTVFGGHTCTETMSALAADIAGLKGTFHNTISSRVARLRRINCTPGKRRVILWLSSCNVNFSSKRRFSLETIIINKTYLLKIFYVYRLLVLIKSVHKL